MAWGARMGRCERESDDTTVSARLTILRPSPTPHRIREGARMGEGARRWALSTIAPLTWAGWPSRSSSIVVGGFPRPGTGRGWGYLPPSTPGSPACSHRGTGSSCGREGGFLRPFSPPPPPPTRAGGSQGRSGSQRLYKRGERAIHPGNLEHRRWRASGRRLPREVDDAGRGNQIPKKYRNMGDTGATGSGDDGDWKNQLNLPAKDTRIKTDVSSPSPEARDAGRDYGQPRRPPIPPKLHT